MTRQRVRIRFRKEGDLRLISHRDLVRVFERLFRRCELNLRMSEGFHPKAKMSFPSALALGVQATNEVMDVELNEEWEPDSLQQRLAGQCPAGLVISHIEVLEAGQRSAQVRCLEYRISIPPKRQAPIADAIAAVLAHSEILIEREGRKQPLDIRPGIESLTWEPPELCLRLLASRQASVRPREVLAQLGLEDLENEGLFLTRTAVEIES